jgi:hypothetical protein
MPQQRKKAKKLNNNNASALKKDFNNNNIDKDEGNNPLDALADKFIDLSELRQKHRGPPPKGILELELEALVFEDLYNSEIDVRQNVKQEDSVSKLPVSTKEEELEIPTENAENKNIPVSLSLYLTYNIFKYNFFN